MNEAYRSFYDLLASGISTAIINAAAFEDERWQAKTLAELDRAKTAFFSNVSHEFRTPLTLMLGPVEDALAASNEPLPPIQRKRLEVVHRNGLRLQRLVNSLLDFSRIEAGRARGAAEVQWQDDRRYLLRSRWGQFVHAYTRDVADLVHVLSTLQRRAPQLGASVAVIPAQVTMSGDPPIEVVPPGHWAAQPQATRHRGMREANQLWSFTTADGPAIESYEFHPDAPDRLWRWTSLRDAGSVERRFPAPA